MAFIVVLSMRGDFVRCDLVIWSGRMSLMLASGLVKLFVCHLVKPFVCHLRAAEEQFDKGG